METQTHSTLFICAFTVDWLMSIDYYVSGKALKSALKSHFG